MAKSEETYSNPGIFLNFLYNALDGEKSSTLPCNRFLFSNRSYKRRSLGKLPQRAHNNSPLFNLIKRLKEPLQTEQ